MQKNSIFNLQLSLSLIDKALTTLIYRLGTNPRVLTDTTGSVSHNRPYEVAMSPLETEALPG